MTSPVARDRSQRLSGKSLIHYSIALPAVYVIYTCTMYYVGSCQLMRDRVKIGPSGRGRGPRNVSSRYESPRAGVLWVYLYFLFLLFSSAKVLQKTSQEDPKAYC